MKAPWRRNQKTEAKPPTSPTSLSASPGPPAAASPPAPPGASAPPSDPPPLTVDGTDPATAADMASRFFERAGVQMPGAPKPLDLTWPGADPFPWYSDLFLSSDDLPRMVFAEDQRRLWAFKGEEESFPNNGGVICGLTRWAPAPGTTPTASIERLIDIRQVFADASSAERWFTSNMATNSEGMPRLAEVTGIGERCLAFGGSQQGRDLSGEVFTFVSFNFLVLVSQVMIKLFASQGEKLLDIDQMIPLVLRTADRAERAISNT